jgi:two-component system phosphate regulon sensor histidine kinase PhoR
VLVSVADNGRGVPEAELGRLFERFFRGDRSRTTHGTGLGLAIVKHIVERHRGKLDIASVLGSGTTVTVLLPQIAK